MPIEYYGTRKTKLKDWDDDWIRWLIIGLMVLMVIIGVSIYLIGSGLDISFITELNADIMNKT
jgi:hypothetical protein